MLRVGRFRFVIYLKDHAPAHVHVSAEDAEAKFNIETGRCLAARGFAEHTIRQLEKIVKQNTDLLREAWKDYEGED